MLTRLGIVEFSYISICELFGKRTLGASHEGALTSNHRSKLTIVALELSSPTRALIRRVTTFVEETFFTYCCNLPLVMSHTCSTFYKHTFALRLGAAAMYGYARVLEKKVMVDYHD